MSDETTLDTTETQNDTAAPPAEAQNTEAPAEHMIPKSRFDEVNSKLKELMTQQEKAAKQREAAERERMEKQKEYQTLYEQAQARINELEPYQERFTSYQQQVADRNEQRVKEIPEAMRSLVPEYNDPFKMQTWLDQNQTVFSKPTAPKLDAGAGNGSRKTSGTTKTELEIREEAARLGLNPRSLATQYGIELS